MLVFWFMSKLLSSLICTCLSLWQDKIRIVLTTRAARVILFLVVSVCVTVRLFVCLFVCLFRCLSTYNSWTVMSNTHHRRRRDKTVASAVWTHTPVGSRDPVYNFLCWQLTSDDIMTSLLNKLKKNHEYYTTHHIRMFTNMQRHVTSYPTSIALAAEL